MDAIAQRSCLRPGSEVYYCYWLLLFLDLPHALISLHAPFVHHRDRLSSLSRVTEQSLANMKACYIALGLLLAVVGESHAGLELAAERNHELLRPFAGSCDCDQLDLVTNFACCCCCPCCCLT